jgi:predicted metal-dependent phosphotriesterase family hydrolase
MNMSTAAYLWVSTGQQSIDQQHDAVTAAGITPDRVFTRHLNPDRHKRNHIRQLEALGYTVTLTPAA